MKNETAYAYIDESGNLRDNILVVCGIVTITPKLLEKSMKNIEKKVGKNTKGEEIKASKQQLTTRHKIVKNIAKLEFETYSIIFNLNTINNKPYDFEEIYRFSMGLLCRKIYLDYPDIEFILDKRYTNEHLRLKLNQSIENTIGMDKIKDHSFQIFHEDSYSNAQLRIADFIAYETYQNYCNNSNFYDLIVPKINKNILYADVSWNKIKKESKTP